MRLTASILVLTLLSWSCASSSRIEKVDPAGLKFSKPPAGSAPIRIVVYRFRNSARIDTFDIIPDRRYGRGILRAAGRYSTATPASGPAAAPATKEAAAGWDEPTPKAAVESPPGAADTSKGVEGVPAKKPAVDPVAGDPIVGEPSKKSEPVARVPSKKVAGKTGKAAPPPPPKVESALVAREVTETLLVQSGRFEVVPVHKLKEALEPRADGSVPTLAEATSALGVRYVLYGDLTEFEIKQDRSYWKIPLWFLLLVGALLIRDRDARAFALQTLIRVMIYTPLSSKFWDKGLGWEDLKLNVQVGMALRLVDPQSGLVVTTADAEITRTESVRNLDLLVWESDRRLKITQSNAGRQIRFAAFGALSDLFEVTDQLGARGQSGPSDRPDPRPKPQPDIESKARPGPERPNEPRRTRPAKRPRR